MRYITMRQAKEGMVLGKALYGSLGDLKLQKGVVLTEGVIKKLLELNFCGLYIQDAFSEGIEIKDVISEKTRTNVTNSVRKLMSNTTSKRSIAFLEDMAELSEVLDRIIDEILSSDSMIFNIIDLKEFDSYTYQHSVNVCVLSCVIGIALKLPRRRLKLLATAAILHDIGKVFIDKDLLNKPGKLTAEEFDVMKSHSMLGYECLKAQTHLSSTVTVSILYHHEKYDGNGYPHGKKENEIPRFSQIITVADVYDAITSKRPYHEAIVPSEAYEFVMGNAGKSFCPEIVEVFSKKIAPFPLGFQVELSNGMEGIVWRNHEDCLTRPLIKLTSDSDQEFLDLRNDMSAYNITIKRIIT